MAPNLQELSLRRMPQVSNQVFAEIFEHLTGLTSVDFCDCEGLYTSALLLLLRKSRNLEQIQLSGCNNAVDDTAMKMISHQSKLEFIDISYCKKVTDSGLLDF